MIIENNEVFAMAKKTKSKKKQFWGLPKEVRMEQASLGLKRMMVIMS